MRPVGFRTAVRKPNERDQPPGGCQRLSWQVDLPNEDL